MGGGQSSGGVSAMRNQSISQQQRIGKYGSYHKWD